MKSLFVMLSFQECLQEYYESRRAVEPSFSWRRFAQLAGFQVGNSVWKLASGQKKPSIDSVCGLAAAMGLDPIEHEYFEALALREIAQLEKAKEYYAQRISALRRRRDAKGQLLSQRSPQRLIYADPLSPVLLLLIAEKGTKEALRSLQRVLNATEAQVREMLGNWESSGLISIQDEKISVSWNTLSARIRAGDASGRSFLRDQLRLSRIAFEQFFH